MAGSVRFYFNVANAQAALWQLLSKSWQRRLRAGVLTGSPSEAQALDRALWTEPALGFLPHCLADSELAPRTPVLLSHDLAALADCAVLFNLTDRPVLDFAGRLIEIVERGNQAGRLAARQRAGAYKSAGLTLEYFDMAEPANATPASANLPRPCNVDLPRPCNVDILPGDPGHG